MTVIPNIIADEIQKIQNEFIWRSVRPKINHKTLCNSFENGGLKNVDIKSKIISLQCFWVRKLYDDNFHDWKVIPLHLISKSFGKNFNFHSNLSFNIKSIQSFPDFYKQIFMNWSNHLSATSDLPSFILSNFLWYNKDIAIGDGPDCFLSFSNRKINYVGQLFDNFGNIKRWNDFKTEFSILDKFYFSYIQLLDAIPSKWKTIIKGNTINSNLSYSSHHLIKKNNIIGIEKLTSKELYILLIETIPHKPTSQNYFEQLFNHQNFIWKEIYLLPRIITLDCYARSFQYKILNNILYLNKKLFLFGKSTSSLCSYCKQHDETVLHLFYTCVLTKELWSHLCLHFENDLILPQVTPQTAMFGFLGTNSSSYLVQNHILLLSSSTFLTQEKAVSYT